MSTLFNLFYLYDPWLFHFFRMSFLCGILAVLLLMYRYIKDANIIHKLYIPYKSISIIILLIIISIIPIIINQTEEYAVIKMYIKTLILFILGISIYNVFYLQNKEKFIQDLNIGIVIQAISGLLALCSIPFIVDILLSTNVILTRFYGSEQEYRLYNITSAAFFQLSAFYVMLLHFILAYNKEHNNVSNIVLLLLLFIGIISGRTFLILSLLSFIIYFKLRYIPVLLIFFSILIYLSLYFPEHKYVAHALEPIINLLSGTGKISSSSDSLIQHHLFMPTLKQFLIGDGHYFTPQNTYYGATDSGFIRQILYGGTVYLLSCFLFMLYFIREIAICWFKQQFKFILSTVLILTMLHIKADTYAFPSIMLVLIMFLSLFKMNNNQQY